MNAALLPNVTMPRFLSTLTAFLATAAFLLMPGMAHAEDGMRVITHLRVNIVTGNDDLRNASYAVASLKYEGLSGNQLTASIALNNGARWVDYSSNTVTRAMPTGLLLANVLEFSIQFTSGQPDIFSTGDNWKMSSITVTAILDDGTEAILTTQAGSPLHTFYSDTLTRWATAL